ncbi:hypothetical protein ACFL6C_08575 [Myxococcota bacterium]
MSGTATHISGLTRATVRDDLKKTRKVNLDPRVLLRDAGVDFLVNALMEAYRDLDEADVKLRGLEKRVAELEHRLADEQPRSPGDLPSLIEFPPANSWEDLPDERDVAVIRSMRLKRWLGGAVVAAVVALGVAGLIVT